MTRLTAWLRTMSPAELVSALVLSPQGRRTVLFLAALLLVLGVSREHAGRGWIIATFVLYVVVATLWVRGQHEENVRRERPWVMPPLGLLVLGLLAAGFFALRLLQGAGLLAALLSAAVPTYLLAGFLLLGVRARPDPPSFGKRLLALGLAGGAIGFGLLGHVWPAVAGLGLAAFAVLLPPGASVLAERRIRRTCRREGLPAGQAAALGAALFLAVVAVARYVSGSDVVYLGFGALALLVVALVSSTLVDVALLLAVIAFVGITPRQETAPRTPEASTGTLVALGDSYMSGEGASTFYAGTDEGGGNGCRRSPTAWAAQAGQLSPFTGLHFLACSGARTYNVRLADGEPQPVPHEQRGEGGAGEGDTQLQQYVDRYPAVEERDPELVVLSIGGNDAGFATIGLMCVAPGDCSENRDPWFHGLEQVGQNLELTYAEVRKTFPDSRVLVVPYPDPIYDAPDRRAEDPRPDCDEVALSSAERDFIGDFVAELNAEIETAAGAADLDFDYLAGAETALADAGLQLCHPLNEGRPGLNFVGVRSVTGDPSQRFNPANWTHNSLHPNERGHAAMLRVFQCWVDAELDDDEETSGDRCGTGAAPRGNSGVSAPEEPCDVYGELEEQGHYETDLPSCIAQGRDWAAEQAGWRGGVIAAGVVAAGYGVWLLSTALFGLHRRRDDRTADHRADGRPASTASGSTAESRTEQNR